MDDVIFQLLARMSSTESGDESQIVSELVNECASIKSSIDVLGRVIDASPYHEKSKLKAELDSAVNDALMLCRHPGLIGRSCVGFICGNDEAGQRVIEDLAECRGELTNYCFDSNTKPWAAQTAIHSFIFDAEGWLRIKDDDAARNLNLPLVAATDRYGREISLSPEQYKALLSLSDVGITPSSVASYISYYAEPRYRGSVCAIIRPDASASVENTANILRLCDAVFMISGKPEKIMSLLQASDNSAAIFISDDIQGLGSAESLARSIISKMPYRNVSIISAADIDEIFMRYAGGCLNVTLADRLLSAMLAYEEELVLSASNLKRFAAQLGRDSQLADRDDSSADVFRKMHESILSELKNTEEWRSDWESKHVKTLRETRSSGNKSNAGSSDLRSLMESARSLEEMMWKTVPQDLLITARDNPVMIHAGSEDPSSLWRRIVLRALRVGKRDIAMSYQKRFESVYQDESFITSLYLLRSDGQTIPSADIERLRMMPDKHDVLRAKISFRDALGISDGDCANIAGLLLKHDDPDELYYLALHLNDLYLTKTTGVNFDDVLTAFRRAVIAGSTDAVEHFAMYCAGNELFDGSKELADMAFPAAAWAFYLLCMAKNCTDLAKRYIKFAAALGHQEASAALADICWSDLAAYMTFDLNSETFSVSEPNVGKSLLNRALSVYEHIVGNDIPVKNANSRLAKLYFCAKQWQRSRRSLGDSPKTADDAFMIALLLKNGRGVSTDENTAIQLMVKAANSGHKLAQSVKNKWYEEAKRKIDSLHGR